MNKSQTAFRLISATVICFLICSCSGGESNVPKKFQDIDLENIISNTLTDIKAIDSAVVLIPISQNLNNSIKTSDVIDSVWYLKLETNPLAVIGEISKLEFYDDKIFIFDFQSSSVFAFSELGKYLFKIDKLGKGPGEFARVWSFSIDRYNPSNKKLSNGFC